MPGSSVWQQLLTELNNNRSSLQIPPTSATTDRGLSRDMAPRVLCLLPVRNGAEHLPSYFENVGHFADGVIALDDGSTDDTIHFLTRDPLVLEVLSNRRRSTYAGWDDARNRQRLLEASAAHDPDWILWLDADEVIAPPDIPLLRRLIYGLAIKGHAYGFEILRMIGNLQHFDRNKLWVYRLFAYSPGQQLPTAKLHFEPIPAAIPANRLHRTIIRILHKGSLTAGDRRARFQKYRQADSDRVWQSSYTDLLAAPGYLWELRHHAAGTDIILTP